MWDEGRIRLLVVDDEADIRNMVGDFLSGSRYTFTTCASYGDAVEFGAAPGAKVELLLTDIILPPFHGRDLANRLVHMHPELKVLFMSGYPFKLLKHHALLPPECAFLPKPFTRTQLLDALAVLAEKARPWTYAGGAAG